ETGASREPKRSEGAAERASGELETTGGSLRTVERGAERPVRQERPASRGTRAGRGLSTRGGRGYAVRCSRPRACNSWR
ncbi:MAG: hypothetical protein ABEI31_01250, partial [Halodesulfurarchaeum sp.]